MTFRADVHLCLVSENIAANLMPLLDSQTRPRQVILLCEAAMSRQADGLERVILSLGDIAVTRCQPEAPDCAEALRKVLSAQLHDYQHQSIALNASGGSRLLGLIAYEAFRAAGKPVFYVDTQSSRLLDLSAPQAPGYALAAQLGVEQLLQVRGFEVEPQQRPVHARHQAFAQELVSNIRHYSPALVNLNWLAASAGNSLSSKPVESWHLASRTFIELLDRLRDLGLASMQRKCLVFPGEAERWFINGGWLDDYVRTTLAELCEQYTQIQDVAAALTITDNAALSHEVDHVFLAGNRLHLIECRAKKLKKGSARSGAEAVHRLDELRVLGRDLDARMMLLSYCPLRDVDVRRMQLSGIRVLQEKQLQNLRFYLQDWLFKDAAG
jgi:hypothetical protein